jgi:MFS family permease
MLGGSLSTVAGYLFAGWSNEIYGWRTTFVLVGLPGVVLSLLAWTTLREPRVSLDRLALAQPASGVRPDAADTTSAPDLKEVFRTLWANRSFRHLALCFSVVSFFGYGILQWHPAYFVRSFGLQTGQLGTWFTLIYATGGLLGTYLGGELAVRRAAHREQLQLEAMAWVYSGFGLISALIYLSPSYRIAFGLMALSTLVGATITGPLFATIQTLVPSRMRAMSIAAIYLMANLIGTGLGPLAAGALSDLLQPLLGQESLRYALLALCPGYFWGGWHLWQASRSIAGDLASVQVPAE